MDKSQTDKSKSTETDTKSGNMNAQTKGADSKAAETKSQTTPRTPATAAAPPAEKRTEISSAIKSTKIEETDQRQLQHLGRHRDPGERSLPSAAARIVEIYPEWRGYDVIFVHGQYIIVRPQTREIVYVIEG